MLYGRPAEVYEEMIARLANAGKVYFRIGRDYIAPTEWLLSTQHTDDDEVLFDNFLSDEEALSLISVAASSGLNTSPRRASPRSSMLSGSRWRARPCSSWFGVRIKRISTRRGFTRRHTSTADSQSRRRALDRAEDSRETGLALPGSGGARSQ